jgi:hypothetical protein
MKTVQVLPEAPSREFPACAGLSLFLSVHLGVGGPDGYVGGVSPFPAADLGAW